MVSDNPFSIIFKSRIGFCWSFASARRSFASARGSIAVTTVRFRVGLRPELEQVSGGTCATCHARVILVRAETTRPLVPFTESHS